MKMRRTALTLGAAGLIAFGGIGLAGCGGDDVENVVSEGVEDVKSVGEDVATELLPHLLIPECIQQVVLHLEGKAQFFTERVPELDAVFSCTGSNRSQCQ